MKKQDRWLITSSVVDNKFNITVEEARNWCLSIGMIEDLSMLP